MIDNKLYSRQLYVLGESTMNKMIKSNILISGIGMLGHEIAKNVILSGYNKVVLHNVTIDDKILYELNNTVDVSKYHGELTEDYIKNFDVLVLANNDYDNEIKLNKICHDNNVKFISSAVNNLYGKLFVDFGDHIVYDPNGEDNIINIVKNIDINDDILITTLENNKFRTGDIVNINNNMYDVKFKSINSFYITGDNIKNIKIGDKIVEVKQNIKLEHKMLNEFVKSPIMLCVNDDYRSYDIENDIMINFKENREIMPMCSIVGGIASHEVIKAVTGKYTPIDQFMYFDESLCDGNNNFDINIFIVGVGAIGCEYLKNLAEMGVKNITITDPDHIEKSNLNRQYLFRNCHIGEPKSKIAAKIIKEMYPNVDIKYMTTKVCENDGLDEKFYKQFDIVLNALDNMDARKYVDSQCVLHNIPLIDSGTLGTKGNVQIIVPHITESYSDTIDPSDDSIPMCTIKHFPTKLEHCVMWAKDLFTEIFLKDDKMEFDKFVNKYFVNNIKKILNKYPFDKVDEKGNKFWSLDKIRPHLIDYDYDNMKKYYQELIKDKCEFDKDDDIHANFVTECSNVRAMCYDIETGNIHKIRGIAGKIIPAMATTTAVVAGQAMLELYKYVNDVGNYKNKFFNLATSYYGSCDVMPANKIKIDKNIYTKWDIFNVVNCSNIQDINKYLKDWYKFDVEVIMYKDKILYNALLDEMEMGKIQDILNIYKSPIFLNINIEQTEEIITIKYKF